MTDGSFSTCEDHGNYEAGACTSCLAEALNEVERLSARAEREASECEAQLARAMLAEAEVERLRATLDTASDVRLDLAGQLAAANALLANTSGPDWSARRWAHLSGQPAAPTFCICGSACPYHKPVVTDEELAAECTRRGLRCVRSETPGGPGYGDAPDPDVKTAAEQRVLDACSAVPDRIWLGQLPGGHLGPLAQAELARRGIHDREEKTGRARDRLSDAVDAATAKAATGEHWKRTVVVDGAIKITAIEVTLEERERLSTGGGRLPALSESASTEQAFCEVYDGAANALQMLDLTKHVRQLLNLLEHHRKLRRSFGDEPKPVRARMNRWGVTRAREENDILAAMEEVPEDTLRHQMLHGATNLGLACRGELVRRGIKP